MSDMVRASEASFASQAQSSKTSQMNKTKVTISKVSKYVRPYSRLRLPSHTGRDEDDDDDDDEDPKSCFKFA